MPVRLEQSPGLMVWSPTPVLPQPGRLCTRLWPPATAGPTFTGSRAAGGEYDPVPPATETVTDPVPAAAADTPAHPTALHATEAPAALVSLSPSPKTAVESVTQAALNATKTPVLAVSQRVTPGTAKQQESTVTPEAQQEQGHQRPLC